MKCPYCKKNPAKVRYLKIDATCGFVWYTCDECKDKTSITKVLAKAIRVIIDDLSLAQIKRIQKLQEDLKEV